MKRKILAVYSVALLGLSIIECASLYKHNVMLYLEKYGYTKNKSLDSMTEEETRVSLEEFQESFSLPVTGDVNNETSELMNQPRCGRPDRQKVETQRIRLWSKNNLTYKINNFPFNGLSKKTTIKEIKRAFGIWSEQIPVTFEGKESGKVDIDITFNSEGDGPGNTLAYAYFPPRGDAYFDKEDWTSETRYGFNLFTVAAHEFGHSLGLEHSEIKQALMYPFIAPYKPNFRLHEDDVNRIQILYGRRTPKCVTESINAAVATSANVTYILKNNEVWKVKNNVVQSNYSKPVSEQWPDIPSDVEAAFLNDKKIHFIKNNIIYVYEDGSVRKSKIKTNFKRKIDGAVALFINRLYLFSESRYWRYTIESNSLKLVDGFPKPIADYWKGVPSSIDGVFYDHEKHINFFKGKNMYAFDVYNNEKEATVKSTEEWITC